ncbi:MAG: methyltransferase protein [Rhodoglobus sp.]|nr:methyltransferase protein [Rhodoglobus sp.]
MSGLIWTGGRAPIQCKACGWEGRGPVKAEITAPGEIELKAVQCPECESIDLLGKPLDSSPTSASIDDYVENGVGIGSIASLLALVDPQGVRRFLDVGCDYGFALDLGRHLYGWEVRGIEPSAAGAKGARELGVDIRREYLHEDSAVGEEFDLILASEVLEHVPDPLPFLRALRARVSAGGHVVVTTPAAEVVSEESPEGEVLVAISPGHHAFIASERGLVLLLERAGFGAVRVTMQRGSLIAIAGAGSTLPPPGQTFPVPIDRLEDYYRTRARSADQRSSLALGMAVRYLRSLVARGAFAEAEHAVESVTSIFRRRHRFDLRRPRVVLAMLHVRFPPRILAPTVFALGMIELAQAGNPQGAVEYFDIALRSIKRWRAKVDVVDRDTADVEFQSAYHRALALSRFDAAKAEQQVLGLSTVLRAPAADASRILAARESRVLVEIASRGQLRPDSELERRVSLAAPDLASSADVEERKAALDAMFTIGLAHAQRGDASSAESWLRDCLARTRAGSGSYDLALAGQCRDQLALLRVTRVAQEHSHPPIHSMIDTYWCDASGTYLDGWMHVESLAVDSISVTIGETTVTADAVERNDLLNHWPDHAVVVKGGFSAYVPGRPHGTAVLTAHTAQGDVSLTIELPDHQLPVSDESQDNWEDSSIMARHVSNAPAGPVLIIGLRSRSEEAANAVLASFGGREIVSLDIHPGFGVTLVGDAHQLSSILPRNHFAVVFSADVLEHVTAPWLVAVECAKVLMPGGLVMHAAPWIWPTHSEPNDFFRYSPGGLAQLFTESIGFRVVETGGLANARIIPSAPWRHHFLRMPTTVSASHSWLVAEKVSDAADAISWPYDAEAGESAARQYPVDGLAPDRAEE